MVKAQIGIFKELLLGPRELVLQPLCTQLLPTTAAETHIGVLFKNWFDLELIDVNAELAQHVKGVDLPIFDFGRGIAGRARREQLDAGKAGNADLATEFLVGRTRDGVERDGCFVQVEFAQDGRRLLGKFNVVITEMLTVRAPADGSMTLHFI
jgi:hypothetical protein